MKQPYFEEVQLLRQHQWLMILLVTPTLLINIYQVYEFGQDTIVNNPLFMIFLLAEVVFIVALFTARLEVKIDEEGFHYRYFPLEPGWRLITPNGIIAFTFKQYSFFSAVFGFIFRIGRIGYPIGHHRSLFKKTKSIYLGGSKLLSLELKYGKQLLISTQNPEAMDWAMKKLMREKVF